MRAASQLTGWVQTPVAFLMLPSGYQELGDVLFHHPPPSLPLLLMHASVQAGQEASKCICSTGAPSSLAIHHLYL